MRGSVNRLDGVIMWANGMSNRSRDIRAATAHAGEVGDNVADAAARRCPAILSPPVPAMRRNEARSCINVARVASVLALSSRVLINPAVRPRDAAERRVCAG